MRECVEYVDGGNARRVNATSVALIGDWTTRERERETEREREREGGGRERGERERETTRSGRLWINKLIGQVH